MAGLYIHVPYCKQACSYCDFYFSTHTETQERWVKNLIVEIKLRKDFFSPNTKLNSIYFGGGTPSLLSVHQLQNILNTTHQLFAVEPNAEITLEANPDDIGPTQIIAWRNLGINRLSIGIQSFRDIDLQLMNRAHTAIHAKHCVKVAQDNGIEQLSIDLIFNIPNLSNEALIRNIQEALLLKVPHISTYGLTIEPKTLLAHQIKKGIVAHPDEQLFAEQFFIIENSLMNAGYDHYEISNYALPNHKAVHNSSYWSGQPYLGLGPSAHSFDGLRTRTKNISNIHAYNDSLENGKYAISETEILTQNQRANEIILTSLRTQKGLQFADLAFVPNDWVVMNQKTIDKFIGLGWIEAVQGGIHLKSDGKLFADAIASALMFEIDDNN